MFIAKYSAAAFRYGFYIPVLVMCAQQPVLAQCGGGGMSCGGHSMSGYDMGHTSHAGNSSMAHSPTGHNPGTTSWNHIRTQSMGVPAVSNWMMPIGHSAHGSAVGTRGVSPDWSSPPFGFRSVNPRPISGLEKSSVHSRATAAYRASLFGHALSHVNGTITSAGRVARGVDDRAQVASSRSQRTISPSSPLPRLPPDDTVGTGFDNYSAHQLHQGITSGSPPDWAARLQRQVPSDLSLPGSIRLRSQERSDQTTLPSARLLSIDSPHASHSWPNSSAHFEGGILPTNDATHGQALSMRPVFRSPLDRYSAIELPATRGLEDFMARSHNVPTTQPGINLSKQAAR